MIFQSTNNKAKQCNVLFTDPNNSKIQGTIKFNTLTRDTPLCVSLFAQMNFLSLPLVRAKSRPQITPMTTHLPPQVLIFSVTGSVSVTGPKSATGTANLPLQDTRIGCFKMLGSSEPLQELLSQVFSRLWMPQNAEF